MQDHSDNESNISFPDFSSNGLNSDFNSDEMLTQEREYARFKTYHIFRELNNQIREQPF